MILKELLTEIKSLSLQEQVQLAAQLLQWVELKLNQEPTSTSGKQLRQAGLNRGAFIFSEDFDDPLPDRFWLGEL